MLRTSVDPASVTSSVRSAIRELDNRIVVFAAAPMNELVGAWSAQSRFTTWLMGVFAATALLLSVVGINGVMSYLVAQRNREFGIRLALGAGRPEIVTVVMKQGGTLIAIGLVLGVAAALSMSQLLESLLFGVSTRDAASLVPVTLLAVVALLACAVPAIRATYVDPVEALRAE